MGNDYENGKNAFGNPNVSVNQLNHGETQGYIAERNRQEAEKQVRDANEAAAKARNGY